MGERRQVLVIWSLPPATGPSAEVLAAIRSAFPEALVHEGSRPPAGPTDVLVIWADADVPEVDNRARDVRLSGLARVAVIAAPGAHGMLEGRNPDKPTHIVKLDQSWDPAAISTIIQGAAAGAQASARASQIAETQENFVAIASHDLRTPVSTLRLLQDLFRSKLSAKTEPLSPAELSDFDELLEIMERNLNKMDGLVGDILEAWRLFRDRPELAMEPVSLGSVAEDVVAGLFPAAMKKDIALDLMADPSLGPVKADPRRVTQVVANLVGNAVKYTPPRGSVTVRTYPADGGDGAVLEVEDTGPGIPEDERGMLFERFARGSAKATGGEPSTGLGLYICREIAEQHGGRVWFEPVNGPAQGTGSGGAAKGSRFLVFWPSEPGSATTQDDT